METERMTADVLLNAFEPPLSPDALLRLEVNLHVPGAGEDAALYIALRVGMERLYVVKHLPTFLRGLAAAEVQTFGKGFTLDPSAMRFDRVDQRILSILSEVEAAQRPCERQGFRMPQNGKFMPLGDTAAKRVLRLLRARPFRLLSGSDRATAFDALGRETLPMACSLGMEGRALSLNVSLPGDVRPVTEDFEFVQCEGRLWQLPAAQRRVVRALLPYAEAGAIHFQFQQGETERVISEVLPQLETACDVRLSEALAARIYRESLKTRAYIDREGERIVARIAFHYGDKVIDPFARRAGGEADDRLLVRDMKGEFAVLETLAQAGFHVSAGQIYLRSSKQALRFIAEGMHTLQKVAEVFASEAFKRMRPRRPQLSGRLGISGGALRLTVFDGDTPLEELVELMQALRDKRKYFRLRDGGFLDLSGLEDWADMADMVSEVGEAGVQEERMAIFEDMPALTLRTYRSAYMTGMLSAARLPIAVDDEVQTATRAFADQGDPCPAALSSTLRPYQERGFQWIQSLYRMRMGGVLADDMGLGKTLQVIAAILWAREKEGPMPSLVIAPTSLVYNWQAEIQRFAPMLSVAVIEGNQRSRFLRWGEIKKDGGVDVIVTSYPLLRRDIHCMQGIPFRFVALDEAQHIKNPQSLSAVSAGRLEARIRLALTGTPMENNPGELWSIFNFVLPGYLMTLQQFMRKYGEGGSAESLRRRIRPFLLRRLKVDVLPELPEKIETRVLADMPAAQRNVYAAAALRLRDRVERVLGEKGLGRGRMEVLSAITQLRQICCHPALAIENYEGSSGKLDALMEILGSTLGTGRRVLLFSQFTSMLYILRRKLAAEGITSLYLDGKTPVTQRMELVNRFNGGEGQVFLISLKAGGAGLNLTGADTVIHYDPWWNPAAEDQATDRAHRIGQRRVVQVIRLITRGTIEEQVVRLSERKRALFDAVVTAGEQMPSDMTEKEIMALFG